MGTHQDSQMGWKYGKKFVHIQEFAGLLSVSNAVDTSQNDGNQVHIAHTHVTDLAGYILDTTTQGDRISHLMPIPWNWDNTREVYVRVHFLSTQAVADLLSWRFAYELWAEDQVPAGPLTAAGNNEDYEVTFADTNTATANTYQTTPWAALAWETYYTAGDIMMIFAVEYDASAGTDDDDELFGVEFLFTVDALGPERKVTSVS